MADPDIFADLGLQTPSSGKVRTEPSAPKIDIFSDLGLNLKPAPEAKATGDLPGVALGAGLINGVPIVGPAALGLAQRAAAGAESVISGTKYADELKRVQDRTEVAGRENSGLSTTGNIGGATAGYVVGGLPAIGAKFLGTAGAMVPRMLYGAGTNALIGGTDAAIRGHDPVVGGVLGMVGGASAPVIGGVAGAGARAATDKVRGLLPTGIDGVSRPAANAINKLIVADDPEAVRAALAKHGELAMLADAGPSLTTVAGGLAAEPGPAQSIVRGALEGRQAGAINRLTGEIDSALGPAPTPSRVEAGLAASREQLGPEYQRVMAGASAVDTTPLANALDAVTANLRGPAQQAVQRVRGFLNIPGTNHLDPNPQALLATRQAIDGLIAGEQNPQVVRQLTMARQQVDTELGRAVPGIKDVDAKFAELSRQSEGLQQGARVLDSGKTAIRPTELAQSFPESALPQGTSIGPSAVPVRTQQGVRAEVDRLVGTNSNDLSRLKTMLQGEGGWNTNKLTTVFGEEPTNRLLSVVEREGQFAKTANTVNGNSETARREAAKAFLKAAEPDSVNLSGASITGLGLQAAKRWIGDPLINMIMRNSSAPMQTEMARVLTMQGATRDQIVSRLLALHARGQGISQTGEALARSLNVGGNRLTMGTTEALSR